MLDPDSVNFLQSFIFTYITKLKVFGYNAPNYVLFFPIFSLGIIEN